MNNLWKSALFVVCFVIPGCEARNESFGPNNEAEVVEDERREEDRKGYLETVAGLPTDTQERAALIIMRQNIHHYEAAHDRWPPSLDELENWLGAPPPALPAGREYDYDPGSGEIGIRNP